jgi:hypothetical protein
MRTISLCLTTFERYGFLIESFHQVLDDPRISEIIIVSDCDEQPLFDKIKLFCDPYPKIKLYRNEVNIDCYRNKRKSISLSTNNHCIILDSDNVIDKKYLDKIFEIEEWDSHTIYHPIFAAPSFDFAEFSGHVVDKSNIAEHMIKYRLFSTACNAMNYFVNGDEYLKVWDGNCNPHTADSIYQMYNWIGKGNKVFFVPGLEYYHRIHTGSHYQNNNSKTGNLYQIIENRLKAMS